MVVNALGDDDAGEPPKTDVRDGIPDGDKLGKSEGSLLNFGDGELFP
jgi:hypothetical protein